jgi:pleiotropic regulator 1
MPGGEHLRKIGEHNAIVNSLALNRDDVLVSGGDNGTIQFHDWDSGYTF